MKKIILLVFLVSITIGVSAQRKVRKEVRNGNDAYKEQLYGKAEQHYKDALEGNSASKEASFNLGNTYYRQGEYDKALDEYRHYLTIENEEPAKASAAWSNIGNSFLKKKAGEKASQQAQVPTPGANGQQAQAPADYLGQAIEAYKNALRINPNDNETRYNLAVAQKLLDDQEKGGDDNDDDQQQQQDQQQKQDQKQDQQNKPKDDPKQDQKQDQQQQNPNQMSKENMEQILKAIEQDEKETQERVQTQKAMEQRQKADRNRQQDKDW